MLWRFETNAVVVGEDSDSDYEHYSHAQSSYTVFPTQNPHTTPHGSAPYCEPHNTAYPPTAGPGYGGGYVEEGHISGSDRESIEEARTQYEEASSESDREEAAEVYREEVEDAYN